MAVAAVMPSSITAFAQIIGLGVVSAVLAGAAAATFRWYADQQIPTGPAVLIGLSAVAAYLNTRTALGQVVNGAGTVSPRIAVFTVSAFAVSASTGAAGARAGDGLAREILGRTESASVERGVGRVVRAVGRTITVTMPADIEDIAGYDPVTGEIKESLAGETFHFPRRLTVEELRTRLVDRIKTDYDVGHIDLTLDEEGTIEYLALGQRVAGIGPTIAPGHTAVAIRADPAHAASSGDVIQVWRENGAERVCNAELRATAGEITTLVVDVADAEKLDPNDQYRLVTLAADARPDREFASLLRAADETLGIVTVEAGSSLAGTPLGAFEPTVIGVATDGTDSPIRTLPDAEHVIAAGQSLYVVATPAALRKAEAAARAPTKAAAE